MSRFKRFIKGLTKKVKDQGSQSDHPAFARINEDLQYASIQHRIRQTQARAEHRAKHHNA